MNSIAFGMIIYFIKYIIAYYFVFILIPRFVFNYDKQDITKGLVTNFIKAIFWLVVCGYITVALRLYEFVTIAVVIIVASVYKFYKKKIISGNATSELKDDLQILVINHLDNVEKIQNKFLKWLAIRKKRFIYTLKYYTGNEKSAINTFVFLAVLIFAAYLRYYDVFLNIAPPTQESYNTLVGMKFIAQRTVFSDSIYPQGFYIVMSTLHKFVQIDHLYVVKFTGALNSLLLVFGIYFFVSRTTLSKASAIISAAIYGLCGYSFVPLWNVQGVCEPVQFSLIFVLPTLYFFFEYITTSKRDDFQIAFFGLAVAGLIHPLAFVFIAFGVCIMYIASIIRDFKQTFSVTAELVVVGLATLLISIIPIGIGLLYKKYFAMDYINILLMKNITQKIPELRAVDYIGFVALGLVFIHMLLSFKDKKKFILRLWLINFSVVTFFIYRYNSLFTSYKYIADATNMLWALLIPVIIGFGFEAIFRFLWESFKHTKTRYTFVGIVLVLSLIFLPATPPVADKIEFNEKVEQYIRISKQYRPTRWMIVSQREEFALTFLNGGYSNLINFTNEYDPEKSRLSDKGGKTLNTQDIFLFCEKKTYKSPYINDNEAISRLNEADILKSWLNKYQQTHKNLSLFYADDNFEIWVIHQEMDREEIINQIWSQ